MSQPTRPGDWMCANCNFLIFARKSSCKQCGAIKPSNNMVPSVKHKQHEGKSKRKPKARTERQRQKQQQRQDKRAQKLLKNETKRMERKRDRIEKLRQNEEHRRQRKLKNTHKKHRETPNISSNTMYWNWQQQDTQLAMALQLSQMHYTWYGFNTLESVYNWIYTSTDEDRQRRSDDSDFEEYPAYPYNYNISSKTSNNWSIFGSMYESYSGNKSASGCIDGNGMVLMSDGTYKLISELDVNDKVKSFPNGVSKIVAVVISYIGKEVKMVNLNGCWVTYKHPILVTNDNKCISNVEYNNLSAVDMDNVSASGLKWVFPKNVCDIEMRYQDEVYNFVLDDGHMLNVNGNWCVTLGDGYDKGKNIGCELWSDMEKVKMYLDYHKLNNTHVIVRDNMSV